MVSCVSEACRVRPGVTGCKPSVALKNWNTRPGEPAVAIRLGVTIDTAARQAIKDFEKRLQSPAFRASLKRAIRKGLR